MQSIHDAKELILKKCDKIFEISQIELSQEGENQSQVNEKSLNESAKQNSPDVAYKPSEIPQRYYLKHSKYNGL